MGILAIEPSDIKLRKERDRLERLRAEALSEPGRHGVVFYQAVCQTEGCDYSEASSDDRPLETNGSAHVAKRCNRTHVVRIGRWTVNEFHQEIRGSQS